MKIDREEEVVYIYEASERIGNINLYYEERSDIDTMFIISLRQSVNEHQQNCIRLTKDEFIHIMPELMDLYNQLLKGDYKV